MSPIEWIRIALLGLTAGVVGGMFGIGGGLIMVPALILLYGFEQRTAFGTSLFAQLLPVGLLGVAEYWRRGEIRIGDGLGLAAGLFVGAWIGGRLVGLVPREPMKQTYGAFLIIVGLYFLLAPSTPARRVGTTPATGDRAGAPPAVSGPGAVAGSDQVH